MSLFLWKSISPSPINSVYWLWWKTLLSWFFPTEMGELDAILCALDGNILLMLLLVVLKILINCTFYCPCFPEAFQAKHSILKTNKLWKTLPRFWFTLDSGELALVPSSSTSQHVTGNQHVYFLIHHRQ